MTVSVTIEKIGRRYYFVGNTFPIKDQLRDAGAKWDAERKQWWTGKADIAQQLSGDVQAQDPDDGLDKRVVGRAQYKGKSYYVVWHGRTRSGEHAAKLCFRDGTKEFWANEIDELRITKEYRDARSIRSLQEYAEQAKQIARGEIEVCAECGRPGRLVADLEDGLLKHYNCCDIPPQ